jgi:RimJ/RimL family protein N-acetyltransferase
MKGKPVINTGKYTHLSSLQQDQMLKLITKTFYNELVTYGITQGNVISISSNLLDCVIQNDSCCDEKPDFYNNLFHVSKIEDKWEQSQLLTYKQVSLQPIVESMFPAIQAWLNDPAIKNSLVSALPENLTTLKGYLTRSSNQYFAILYQNKLAGLIGADNIDGVSMKLEMKKFIGDKRIRGKGVGKQATFLFLYFVFTIMKYNKVYIYTLDKNIANINLNSKFGFILEGILYQEKLINDEMQDILRMCILRNSWNELFS